MAANRMPPLGTACLRSAIPSSSGGLPDACRDLGVNASTKQRRKDGNGASQALRGDPAEAANCSERRDDREGID